MAASDAAHEPQPSIVTTVHKTPLSKGSKSGMSCLMARVRELHGVGYVHEAGHIVAVVGCVPVLVRDKRLDGQADVFEA